jgi:hypothetical protein
MELCAREFVNIHVKRAEDFEFLKDSELGALVCFFQKEIIDVIHVLQRGIV